MASKLESGTVLSRWFRWLPRGFLLAAVVLPVLLSIFSAQWHTSWSSQWFDFLGSLVFSLPILGIVITIAWFWPTIGGIAAIVCPLLLLWIEPDFRWEIFSAHDLAFILHCVLLVIGGALSITWGRQWQNREQKVTSVRTTASVRYSWLRWLARGFLLILVFLPIFFAQGWSWPDLFYFLTTWYPYIFLIIAIIAWVAPVVGGILAIAIIPVLGLMQTDMSNWVLFYTLYAILFVGGILSIIWGAMRWRWKHNQVQINAKADSE
jgi:hypothetical protein